MSTLYRAEIGIVDRHSSFGWQAVGTYDDYADAQRDVDRLSDAGFPVENTEIVGRGVRFVERVIGRLTYGRAAISGAVSGAWFGLFIGLLVGLFTSGPVWLGLILGGSLLGAVWGAIFGLAAHWSTGGRRDFASVRGLVAARYQLMVVDADAERAQALLAGAR